MSSSEDQMYCRQCGIDVEPLPYGACPTCYEPVTAERVEATSTSAAGATPQTAEAHAAPPSATIVKPGSAELTFALVTLPVCIGAFALFATNHSLTGGRAAIIGVLAAGAVSRLWRYWRCQQQEAQERDARRARRRALQG